MDSDEENVPSSRPLILLVDDDSDFRKLIKAFLIHSGFDILEALNGSDALRQWLTSSRIPSLMLTDNQMPELRGIDLIRCLDSLGYRPWPIIISSAEFTEQDLTDIAALSIPVHVLRKPFVMNDLLVLIQAAIANVTPK